MSQQDLLSLHRLVTLQAMAVLWQHQTPDNRYEVRSAGRARRLYTNGVFHSQYNPAQPVSGGVWDLLFLPAFFRPLGSIRRVLILGVGGGAVIRQLEHFIGPAEMVGVDLDTQHLDVAGRYFGVSSERVSLQCADAGEWLQTWRGEPFDLVVDDLFGDHEGEPVRAIDAKPRWFQRLLKVLAPQGVVVMNFPTLQELHRCGYCTAPAVQRRFAAAYVFSVPRYENAVAAFLRGSAELRELNRRLVQFPQLDRRRKGCRLRYRVRRLQTIV